MKRIIVRPHLIHQFVSIEGSTFCLVTNPGIVDCFAIERNGSYKSYLTTTYEREEEFVPLLRSLPEPAHVLVASPHCFVQSPTADVIGRRQVVAMACNSTPSDFTVIEHFLKVIEQT